MTTDLASALAELASDLNRDRSETPTAEAVVSRAVAMVHDADAASITVRRRHRYLTLASTSDEASAADRLQYEHTEGPCVEVAQHVEWLRSGDVASDPRWPTWGPLAAAEGFGSLLSIPLVAREVHIGALNMYSTHTGGFPERDDVDFALLFGIHAAQAMSSAKLVSGLEAALGSRHVIGVAQGMLVERFGLTVEQSFSLLTRISSQTNVKVSDLAAQVVATGRLPGDEGPHVGGSRGEANRPT